MDTSCCQNPLGIRNHHRQKPAYLGTKIIDKLFCDTFQIVCPKLQKGMVVCAQCRNNIGLKGRPYPTSSCVDPFDQGQHTSKKYHVVTMEMQRRFFSMKSKLTLGANLCTKCHMRLAALPQVVKEPLTEEGIDLCCNPFKKRSHSAGKCARSITQTMIDLYSTENIEIRFGDLICMKCRFVLHESNPMKGKPYSRQLDTRFQESPPPLSPETSNLPLDLSACRRSPCQNLDEDNLEEAEMAPDPTFEVVPDRASFEMINKCLSVINVDNILSFQTQELVQKYNDATTKLKSLFQSLTKTKLDFKESKCDECEYIIQGAKKKFRTSDRSTKYVILTTMPKQMSITAATKIFSCGKPLVRKAFLLREKCGPFSAPVINSTKHHKISNETKQHVRNFYKRPEISRSLPGKRESLLVKKPGENVYEREGKYRLLCTIPEIYEEYKLLFPESPMSLSTFQILRPKECIPVGRGVYHNTCTCIIHENFDLMLYALGKDIDLKYILNQIPCDSSSEKCMMGYCTLCPKSDSVTILFNEIDSYEEIIYYQWSQTDGTELVRICEPVSDFKHRFLTKLPALLAHHFLVRKQNLFVQQWRENHHLYQTEALVNVDFAQHYSFVYQDEIQSAHWGHKQATVHPFHVEFTCQETGILKQMEYIVISDDLVHNTVAYHTFQKSVISELKKDLPFVTKLRYVSDGSSAQYKNYKNIINMLAHEADFGLSATLEYFPTAHGKGNCDRLSAIVKQTVRRDSLRKKKGATQILSPNEMYLHLLGKNTRNNRKYVYVTKEQVKDNYRTVLKDRFAKGKTIPGTRDFHSFCPISNTSFVAKRYSLQEQGTPIEMNKSQSFEYNIEEFIAVRVSDTIQFGKIVQFVDNELTVQFLKHIEKSDNIYFTWANFPLCQNINPVNICFKMSAPKPTTQTGRYYTLSKQDFLKFKETK